MFVYLHFILSVISSLCLLYQGIFLIFVQVSEIENTQVFSGVFGNMKMVESTFLNVLLPLSSTQFQPIALLCCNLPKEI